MRNLPARLARLGVLGLTALGGCYTAAVRTDGPVQAPEGYRVSLLGVDCFDGLGPDDPTAHELDVQLEIDNPTRSVLRLATGELQLTVGDYRANPISRDTILVQRNESLSVHLQFAHPARCADWFTLNLAHALSVERRLVAIAPLRFAPR